MKPITPQQCANINCDTAECIYPDDVQFWHEPLNPQYPTGTQFWYCSENCFAKTRHHNKGLKQLAVKKAWQQASIQREVLGL